MTVVVDIYYTDDDDNDDIKLNYFMWLLTNWKELESTY
jgi:hypothetical protein